MLHQVKKLMSSHFKMKDIGNASFVFGIKIHRDRSQNLLGLSQISHIERMLKKYHMSDCKACDVPIAKGDKLNLA